MLAGGRGGGDSGLLVAATCGKSRPLAAAQPPPRSSPWSVRESVAASSSNQSPAQAATFVSAVVSGYFGEARAMCPGGVPAHWPGGGHAVKGILLLWSVTAPIPQN